MKAVNRADQALQSQLNIKIFSREKPGFLFVKSEYKMIRINLDEILFMEALKEYTKIYTVNKPILTLKTLKEFEITLPGTFMRGHKSYIVPIDKINYIERKAIVIRDKLIPIGQGYRDKFLKAVSFFG